MAEINSFSEISENFDTIKTLLNSIRAQGILNTSDVDKLLGGINSKLEKINTEEDIDLIKAFLSELKSNLDERHNVLISKFGAIESLFSNLLKNSSETLKSSEVKELFDIVATNLSVFSREVVSQKEVLTDITLRLDNMRSDDSQKKDIIKSVSALKTDIDHLSNGFDSIVLSLNENFKTVLKSITDIDQSDLVTQFGSQLTDVVNSSNTILSALQLLDKKNANIEEDIKSLATQEDLNLAKRGVVDLTVKNQELTNSVQSLVEKSYKIDNLSDKIDASVNIIAGLKSAIAEGDEQSTHAIIDKLSEIEASIQEVSSTRDFENMQKSLDGVIREILNGYVLNITNIGEDIKYKVSEGNDKLAQILEANITRTISDLTANTDSLSEHLQESHNALAGLCERSFSEVMENVSNLKNVISQLDENNVSSNNAIFSNITDRLAIFENSLKNSLEKQEDSVSSSSNRLVEQLESLKQVSNNLDYKMDSSVIELGSAKQELAGLKDAIDSVLALNFVETVKNLKVDLYAVKQDLFDLSESSLNDLSEQLRNDLYNKYELLVSKLDNVEDEFKSVQVTSLGEIKSVLDKISSSIVDILSYVSVRAENSTLELDAKLAEVTKIVKDNNLNYIENVKDIVEVIRNQVESDLEKISEDSASKIDDINKVIEDNTSALKEDIQKSYEKLVDVQTNFDDIKDALKLNNITLTTNVGSVLESADSLKLDFDTKLAALKNNLLEKVSEFKKEFTCENADNISELKFNSESLHSKAIEQSLTLKNELKDEIEKIIDALKLRISDLKENVAATTLKVESSNKNVVDFMRNDFSTDLNNTISEFKDNVESTLSEISAKTNETTDSINVIDASIKNLSTETTTALSSTLAKILDNFVSLKSIINGLSEQSADDMKHNVENIKQDFAGLKEKFENLDSNIDEDLTRQFGLIERNFDTLTALISNEISRNSEVLSENLEANLKGVAEILSDNVSERLEDYKTQIEKIFDNVNKSNNKHADYIKERVSDLNSALEDAMSVQNGNIASRLNEISSELNQILTKNIEITSEDYNELKTRLVEITSSIEKTNVELVDSIKNQLDDITKFIDSGLELQAQELNAKLEEVDSGMQNVTSKIADLDSYIDSKTLEIKDSINSLEESSQEARESKSGEIISQITSLITERSLKSQELFTEKSEEIIKALENSSEMMQDSFISKAESILEETSTLQGVVLSQIKSIETSINSSLKPEMDGLSEKLEGLLNEQSLGIVSTLTDNSKLMFEELSVQASSIKEEFEAIKTKIDEDDVTKINLYQNQFDKWSKSVKEFLEESKESSDTKLEDLTSSIDAYKNASLVEHKSIEECISDLKNNIDSIKQNSSKCKDLITDLLKERLDIISGDIEKETDIIAKDLLEQFAMLKDAQKDDMSTYASRIEGSVEGYIVDAINDLKSYLDFKTDASVLNSKLDNLRIEMEKTSDDVLENINKLLDVSVFSDSIEGLKKTNEVLLNSMAEKLNSQMQEFIKENISEKTDEMIDIFDKTFVSSLVEKYDQLNYIASSHNESLNGMYSVLDELVEKIISSKSEIKNSLSTVVKDSIDDLSMKFDELRTQLGEGSRFDKQILGIENLVKEQLSYVEDINDLCSSNLPEIAEIGATVKYGIKQSLDDLMFKIDANGSDVAGSLNSLKSDIITQFINVFNQISFVAEQEEIIDFIQEKHTELITILSHIVSTGDKIDSIRDDIDSLNEKITAIMSSDGDVDYVYSLQDLESDIAGLRLVLNEMKNGSKSKELDELVESTNNIYKLVETIKSEIPNLDSLSEDIVSISSRTNKLLLTSDESYKTLQDNLQDFKLVINDLDERTRNFAQEAGLDKIDSKLGAINTMIQNGAKTNQVFNQVFEYLAEWVDSAGAKISTISEKVDTLDDIGQIKVMLEDLKAEAEDSTDSEEIVEALGNIFEKQVKKISSLEAKLDRMIVATTINNKNNKLDLSPMEDTLNKFLVAMDEKMELQQKKINVLEEKLTEVMSVVDNKDTVQLTKKVGGMDRQIAKLNKSIEKIASHVVEK